jgi:glycosyltransferase involved in cell wall biosynthesis
MKKSTRIILSSFSALDDLKSFLPEHASKVRILKFVAIPDKRIYELGHNEEILKRYSISEKYFYLPNQLWKHKNHLIVFEAVRILRQRGKNILLICSGSLNDYRDRNHIHDVKGFIGRHGLNKQIRLLGMIDYLDVLYFMRHCVSVINPSLFEGWSTTVEEAKSIGKNLIVSKIPVHLEQNPAACAFFDPTNPEELADILAMKWESSEGGPDFELEERAAAMMGSRVYAFGHRFKDIVAEVTG